MNHMDCRRYLIFIEPLKWLCIQVYREIDGMTKIIFIDTGSIVAYISVRDAPLVFGL